MNENNQANNQKVNQEAIKASEAKTVVNGKVVSIKQAQAALEAAEAAQTATGVQSYHSNHTEAVAAGQTGKTTPSSSDESARQAEVAIKQGNIQSGQSHLNEHMQQAGQSQAEKMHQEAAAQLKTSKTKASNKAAE